MFSVLEPSEKMDKERHGQKGGFGLGSSIVNDIAKTHNGSIQLENRKSVASAVSGGDKLVH